MENNKDLIKGVSWLGLLRGSTRMVAFVRIAILARVLLPYQFGVFGVVSLTLTLLQIIFETGINIFFVQKEGAIKGYIDTAWVISIIRGLFIGLIMFVGSYPISIFFNNPDSTTLLRLAAFVPVITGFINPAEVIYWKNLKFKKEFYFRLIIYSVDAVVAIIFSLLFRTAVGIVLGLIAGCITEVILSFMLFTIKPTFKFSVSKARNIVNRGKWITLLGIFDYIYKSGDDIIVGRLLNTGALGIYQMAYKISSVPISEVSDLIGKVTFPIFSDINNKVNLIKTFNRSMLIVAIISTPFCLLIAFFPKQIIYLFLGKNWLYSARSIQILAFFGLFRGLMGPVSSLFLSLKKQELVTITTFIGASTLLMTIFPLVKKYGIEGAAISAVIGSLTPWPIALYHLRKLSKNNLNVK